MRWVFFLGVGMSCFQTPCWAAGTKTKPKPRAPGAVTRNVQVPSCGLPDTPVTMENVPPPPRESVTGIINRAQVSATRDQAEDTCSLENSSPPSVKVPAFCADCKCTFSGLQSQVRGARDNKDCFNRFKSVQKRYSPWKDLDRFDRFKMTLELANRFSGAYDHAQEGRGYRGGLSPAWKGIKQAMMACIATKETGGELDPLVVSIANCWGPSEYGGMAQQHMPTYKVAVEKGMSVDGYELAFRSTIPRYRVSDAYKNQNILTTDPELQIEFMDYFLTTKLSDLQTKLGTRMKDYDLVENLASWYNGSENKAAYGLAIRACTYCAVKLVQKGSYTPTEADNCMGYASFPVCKELMDENKGEPFCCSIRGHRPDKGKPKCRS